jgi:hypothetical protein
VCCGLWPGNPTDVTTLVPAANRLENRFGIQRPCVVADRGMVSGKTRAGLERLGFLSILGVRMRSSNRADEVLSRPGRYHEAMPPRKGGKDPSPLEVKEIGLDDLAGMRHVACRNREQAAKDRHDREAIIAAVEEAPRKGRHEPDRQQRRPPLRRQGQRAVLRHRLRQSQGRGAPRRHVAARHQC